MYVYIYIYIGGIRKHIYIGEISSIINSLVYLWLFKGKA